MSVVDLPSGMMCWLLLLLLLLLKEGGGVLGEGEGGGGVGLGVLEGGPWQETPPTLLEQPTDEIVRRNDPLTLYCKATGTPKPTILWYRVDSTDPLRDRDGRLQFLDGSLFFYRVRGKDRGTYYCVASNSAGSITSRRVTVQMAYLRETFRFSPSSLGVNEGDSAVFECEPPKGHPTPVVTWRLDGRDLVLPRHRFRQEGSTLLISHVLSSDEGEYQCVVTNMAAQRLSIPATLTVYESARVGGVVKSMVGVAGHDVTLPCAPSGTPSPQVVWLRADGVMPAGRAGVGRDWSLTIRSVRPGDQGVYVCQATNSAGTHAANTSLLVVERPRMEGGAHPRVAAITPTHVRKITCPVTATPTPLIFWVKENHGRREAERPVVEQGDDSDVYQVRSEQPQVVVRTDVGVGVEGVLSGAARVDEAYNLHVTTRHEGLWACMAANEVDGVQVPVRVVGEGVARGEVDVGVVGVDEVEARTALLTPTIHQGHPAPATPTTATISWRLTNRPKHLEGLFILGCERGSGFLPPRINQQLQPHDLSLLHPLPSPSLTQSGSSSSSSSNHGTHPTLAALTQQHLHREPGQHQDARGGYKGITDYEGYTGMLHPNSTEEMDGDEGRGGGGGGGGLRGELVLPSAPSCSHLRVMGHTLSPGRSSYLLRGLQPFTSYWFVLLPHYKGVLGVPSNIQPFTTPQDVPSGWAVLSRWWAGRVGASTYALTLHWRPLPPHLAHGIITKYLVSVKERDTGMTHNVSVVGDLTSLTLPNITSSRVEVTLFAATEKGLGPPSPPTQLNLLVTHLKDGGVGVGMVRSAWFLVLAGGAVAVLVVVVGCVVLARSCSRRLHHTSLPSEVIGPGKMCGGVGSSWAEVGTLGTLWTPVPTHDLSSDKSERKLLANGSSSEYAEVEAGGRKVKDGTIKNRLDVWVPGLLSSSTSPSHTSTPAHRTRPHHQSETLPAHGHSSQDEGRGRLGGSHTSTYRDSGSWYTGGGECCTCCPDNPSTLPLPPASHGPSNSPSGCSTVRHVSPDAHHRYSPPMEYDYTRGGTNTYEAVNTYEEADAVTAPTHPCHLPHLTQGKRNLRLHTESTTDLSLDCYNFSDEDEDITQSCSDTEASFFIPHERKHSLQRRVDDKEMDSSCEDLHNKAVDGLLHSGDDSARFQSVLHRIAREERSQEGNRSSLHSLRGPEGHTESSSNSGTSSTKPLLSEKAEKFASRAVNSHNPMSQKTLEG